MRTELRVSPATRDDDVHIDVNPMTEVLGDVCGGEMAGAVLVVAEMVETLAQVGTA